MSTIDIGMLLNGMGRRAAPAAGSPDSADSAEAPLRVVLLQGEALRLPVSRATVSALSGTAWITQCGEDRILAAGGSLTVAACGDSPVVSPLGTVPLLLEVR